VVILGVGAFPSFFLRQAMLTAPATHATFSTPGALRAVVGNGLYNCLGGLLGLGIGLIVRDAAGAIGAFVGVLLILPIVVSALPQSIIYAVQRYELLQVGKIMITVRTVQLPGARVIRHGAHLMVSSGSPNPSRRGSALPSCAVMRWAVVDRHSPPRARRRLRGRSGGLRHRSGEDAHKRT
jgi:hypothetical protein